MLYLLVYRNFSKNSLECARSLSPVFMELSKKHVGNARAILESTTAGVAGKKTGPVVISRSWLRRTLTVTSDSNGVEEFLDEKKNKKKKVKRQSTHYVVGRNRQVIVQKTPLPSISFERYLMRLPSVIFIFLIFILRQFTKRSIFRSTSILYLILFARIKI